MLGEGEGDRPQRAATDAASCLRRGDGPGLLWFGLGGAMQGVVETALGGNPPGNSGAWNIAAKQIEAKINLNKLQENCGKSFVQVVGR